MKLKIMIAVIALIAGSTFSVSAQNRSLQDESLRIRQGAKSGQLTPLETARLTAQKKDLLRQAIQYKANDGRIGPVERADLRRDNRQLNKNIYRQKHDRQRRF